MPDVGRIAARLIAAYDRAEEIAPISAEDPAFDVAQGYDVLQEIERRRVSQGWSPVGRKIGFTNRTIWPRYGVDRPMWAHIWSHTVHFAGNGRARLALAPFVQPRIEPEVVFRLHAGVPVTDDPEAVLGCVEWLAAGFEIAQSHFPEWKFTAADCTAAFGLHGALVIGPPLPVTRTHRRELARTLASFTLTLRRDGTTIDTGVGANVLGSPALALAHLARVLAGRPQFPPLAAGEIITTGTVTDAWCVAAGETWSSEYGALGAEGIEISFC
jgi:2-oxo-3-hexenedioate decarboxylase